MRILIDECVDWRLVRDLAAHEAKTVKQAGWERVDDAQLLSLAAKQFDVFITVDKELPAEQNLASFVIAVIVLRGRTARLDDLRELVPSLHVALQTAGAGDVQVLNWRDIT